MTATKLPQPVRPSPMVGETRGRPPRSKPDSGPRVKGPDPAKKGYLLDIGCGNKKYNHAAAIGMDIQDLPGVDIVHDWNDFPWPLEDESCITIFASHVVEHVNPADGHFLRWMDECWRCLKLNGRMAIVTPFGGSEMYYRDPTHVNGCTHETPLYFDPTHPSEAYSFYEPAPFWIRQNDFMVEGNLEIVLEKLADKPDYHANGKLKYGKGGLL